MNDIIIFCARYLFVFVVLGIVVAWLRCPREDKLRFLLTTIAACVVAVVLSRIASRLYYDPRPFVTDHVKPLIAHAADNGFPSDHALFTMTLTAATYFFSRKIADVMLVLSILVGIARVLAKVHSPIDIAGAWLIGVIGAFAGYYAIDWLFKRHHATKKDQ